MKIDILTLFPEMFTGAFEASIIKRAVENKIIEIRFINIRDFATDKHQITDDAPFGGGGGMVMTPQPLAGAIEFALEDEVRNEHTQVVYLSPQGVTHNQEIANELAALEHMILLCGRYEGIDERICEVLIDREISIGDYVLSGGEYPAMIIVDSIVRLLPGALGNEDSFRHDSFYKGLLDYPHYTRPREFCGRSVPDVLLSGHHKEIEIWRRHESLRRTFLRRPDLLKKAVLSREDLQFIQKLEKELGKKDCEAGE